MNVLASPFRLLAVAFFAAASIAGCSCEGGGTVTTRGELGVVYQIGDETRMDRDALYDFGSVFMGQPVTKKVVIRNLGRGKLTLSKLEKTEGVDVQIGETSTGESPLFTIPFEEGTALNASEEVALEVVYSAPLLDDTQIDHEVKLLLRAGNTREGEETAVITLRARAVSGVCELPSELDFGNVMVDDLDTKKFTIRNPKELPAEAMLGEITSNQGDSDAFSLAPESPRGNFTVDPNTERDVVIEFHPTAQQSYFALVKAKANAQCPEQTIKLVGNGVGSVLSWQPTKLKFGYVTPGIEVTKEVTFSNFGPKEVQLRQIKTNKIQEFWVQGNATQLTVPAATRGSDGVWTAGTAKLPVVFKPVTFAIRTDRLEFKTNLEKQPEGALDLEGYGGGPDIEVSPSPTLNFGQVAFFQGTPTSQKRKLMVMNVGTTPPSPDASANLHIEKIEVESESGTEDQTFAANLVGYDDANGILAKAGENTRTIEVTITAQSVGMKKAKIKIYSNDADESMVEVMLAADVIQLPPCQYSVSPTQLPFGVIQPPLYRDLAFTVTNLGTGAGDRCLFTGLDLTSDSDPAFSLTEGPQPFFELGPTESKSITVRVHPQGQMTSGVSNITGTVEFYASTPFRPTAQVGLSAQIAESCLTIAPNALDFGNVKVGCSSATRSFSIYSTCGPGTVKITAFGFQNAGGEAAGGPNCPGTAPCPEFIMMQSPVIPSGGLPLTPASPPETFQVKYRPINIGTDSGQVAITANQNGTNVTYVVPLLGTGDTLGIQTDLFVQDAKPKADILLNVDNSGSMSSSQTSLATNFGAFIKYAQSAKVDYHIAVTTSDNDPGGEQGKFVYGAGHTEKILTPNTLKVEDKFKAKVNVGTSGSATEMCFEPSLKALTPPLSNTDNAGFLRNEAALAIVCISDEEEQSPQSVTYYLNAFYNIKGHNRKNMFTFNAIAGFSAACPYDDGAYAQMVQQTSGVKEDICTPDWAKALEKLGQTAFGFRTKFFLTSSPDLTKAPIEVMINGQPVPAQDIRGATVWTYDSVDTSVNFEPMYVPEPGQTMTITYHTTCYP